MKWLSPIGRAIPEPVGRLDLGTRPGGTAHGRVVVGELQGGHREVRIELQRGEQRRFDGVELPVARASTDFGVLPQRLERSGRHLLQRLRGRGDRVQRFAEVPAQ